MGAGGSSNDPECVLYQKLYLLCSPLAGFLQHSNIFKTAISQHWRAILLHINNPINIYLSINGCA